MKAKRFLRFAFILAVLSLSYSPQLSALIQITSQPIGGTYCAGDPVSLSISVSVTRPSVVSFQWYRTFKTTTEKIPGATGPTLSVSSIQTSQLGNYYCQVYDSYYMVTETSNIAKITVESPPTITGGTSGFLDKCTGTATGVYVYASSTGTLDFQWQKDGSNISGANENEIFFEAVSTANDGAYRCIVGHNLNTCKVTSSTTTITVATPSTSPTGVINNSSAPYCEGSQVSLSVQGGSLGNYAKWYWYKGGISSPETYIGQGTSTTINTPALTTNAYYWVRAEDGMCSNTNYAKILVTVAPKPKMNWAAVGDCCLGSPAYFSVDGSLGGAPDARWVWYQNDYEIFRTDNNAYQFTPTNPGSNTYKVRAEGSCGTTTYSTETHTVKTAPNITEDLAITKKCEGDSHTLQISATGTAPLTYRFSKNGNPFTGWISSNSYTLNGLSDKENALFKVEVHNDCAPDDESSAQLTVNPLPEIDLGNDVSICQGESATIGTDLSYPHYSWNTGPSTAKIAVSAENTYILTVTDTKSCSNSDDIFVNVDEPITPVSLGEDKAYCMGDDALIDAGTGYDHYTWSNGQNEVSNISVTESGDYSVSVKNDGNVCTSDDEVHITVYKPYEDEEICMVLIDPDTRKNMIVWEKTPDVRTEKYQVWKVTANPHEFIKEVTYSDTSVVIDMNSKPTTKADAYVLVVIDSCGNASEQSMWHKPFLLQSSLGLNDIVNLNWQAYLMDNVEFTFESIVIFRGTDSLSLEPIDTMFSGFDQYSYTDENPPKGVNVYYRIGGEKLKACDPNGLLKQKSTAGPYVHSLSNLEDNRLKGTGIINSSSKLKLYPNPMTDASYLELSGINYKPAELKICDLSGRILRTSIHYEDKILIERKELKSGCYLIRISCDKEYSGMLMVR